jgi:hypothetical protein
MCFDCYDLWLFAGTGQGCNQCLFKKASEIFGKGEKMNGDEFLKAKKENLSETPSLLYVGGYKYQSRNAMIYNVFIYPEQDIVTDLIILRSDGWLWVSPYFAWDGCSGPTWDDSTNMRAGHCHDALYALFRMGLLDPGKWRPVADDNLHRLMVKDGAWKTRAGYYRWAVNHFASFAADHGNQKKPKVAPKN